MKKFVMSLCLVTLVIATSCTGTTQEGQQAGKPATSGNSSKAVQTVAKKPVAGEAEHTFSLSVPFESVALAQGEEQSVQIGINRGENFGEQVEIKVSGLPMGVTVETKEPVITQGSTGVELTLKAASDAALGDFTAKVTGQTASSGADFSEEFKLTVSQKQPE
jgi:uncharacterized membrane protein